MQSVTAVLMRKSAHKFRWSCIANQVGNNTAVLCMRTSQLSHKLLPGKRSFAFYTGVKTLPELIYLRASAVGGSILDSVPLIRKLHMEPVQKVKDRFLSMSLEERRKEYFCKNNFQVFDNIPVWEEYYAEKKTEMPTVRQEYEHEVLEGRTYKINHALNRKVALWPEGDITRLEIDAIVNAANKTLMGGGGVDGCIHKAAGRYLKEECKMLGGCETGEAKITAAYNLPAKYVIHTVGPQGKKPPLLESCYRNSFDLLVKNNLRSIAFPCISTGIYGYPQDAAANVALRTVREYLEKNPDTVDRVVFCTFLRADVEFYEERMKLIFPVE